MEGKIDPQIPPIFKDFRMEYLVMTLQTAGRMTTPNMGSSLVFRCSFQVPSLTELFGRMTSPRSRGISSDSTIPDPVNPETVGSNGIGSRRRRSSWAVKPVDRGNRFNC